MTARFPRALHLFRLLRSCTKTVHVTTCMGTACSQRDPASSGGSCGYSNSTLASVADLNDAQRRACGTRTRMLSKQERCHRCTIVRREQLAGCQPGHLRMPRQLNTLLAKN